MDIQEGIDVYSTAKSEYTQQFCIFLIPALLTYFLSLLEEAKEKEKDLKRVLWTFQNLLKDIPEWNTDKVLRETETIQSNTKCDYLEELLTAVFVAHTKVLSAIRINSKSKKLQITIPKVDHFLHRTLSECARSLWSNAYLFSEQATSVDRQKNLRQVEHLLHQAILQSIRGMLPVKNILKEYLTDDGDVEGDEEVKETVPEIEVAVTKNTEEDLSGSVVLSQTAQEAPKEAPKEEPKEVPKEVAKETPEETSEETSEETKVPEETQPVIFVDTEQSVKFTDHDAMFDSDNPGQNSIDMKEHMEESDLASVSAIDILDPLAGGLDDFEDLDKPADQPMGLGDFETLA